MADDNRGRGTTTAPREPAASPFAGHVIIEVGDERNRSFQWAPTKDYLRGAWLRTNLTPDEGGSKRIAGMPDIPGMRIEVNGPQRVLRLFDPLALPEHATILEEVQRLCKHWWNDNVAPFPEKVYREAGKTQIKTWLYWMHRLVSGTPYDEENPNRRPRRGGPQARLIQGTMPSLMDLLRLPGRIRIGNFDSVGPAIKFLEDAPKMDERNDE